MRSLLRKVDETVMRSYHHDAVLALLRTCQDKHGRLASLSALRAVGSGRAVFEDTSEAIVALTSTGETVDTLASLLARVGAVGADSSPAATGRCS